MPTALITGASSGLGEQFAYALAREHYDLVLTARREDRLNAVAAQARGAGAGTVRVIATDLGARNAPAQIHQRLADEGVRIDYLVNNAGFATSGRFDRMPLEREIEEIELNITALVAMTRLFIPAMVEAGRGTIINVASTAAFQPTPFMTTYGATKAFVLHFSEGLASELEGTGVLVTALCPGPVKTEFQEVAGIERAWFPSFIWTDPETVVHHGMAAAASGHPVYIAGALNTAMALATRFAPRSVVRRLGRTMFRHADK